MTVAFSAHLRRFEANVDEGFNLAKAALLARGHALYEEVWSDQPPLFTEMLRALFAVTGESVLAARLLVLGFACLLLWACARTARIAWGPRAALAAPFLVLVVPPFQPLSVAVMIGLPAIAFGALALAAAAQGLAGGRRPWIAASGALLALGCLTKLFVAILVPVLLAGVTRGSARGARARACAVWLGAFLVTGTLGFLALAGPAALEPLVAPHLAAATDARYRSAPEFGFLVPARGLWWLGALGAAGAVAAVRRRGAIALCVAAWGAAATVLLALHRPIWGHHLLIVTVPACLLAAPVAVAILDAVERRVEPWLAGRAAFRVALAVAMAFGATWLLSDAGRWRRPRPPGAATRREEAFVAEIGALARPGDRMLTDMPMYAFRAGVPVVPETAVFSGKRFATGLLTEDRLREILARERPGIVLVGRFPLPRLRADLATTYRRLLGGVSRELYLREETGSAAPPCPWPGCLDEPASWYGEPPALRLAGNILRAQHRDGGWGKDEDRWHGWVRGDRLPLCEGDDVDRCSTIDNGATTSEIVFLARVHAATGEAPLAQGVERGVDLLLDAQTPSGGWPQVPGARPGSYPAAITLNDDAMAHVMDLLDAVARDPAYAFLDEARRVRARQAFERGVACLVRAQVTIAGVRTVWCAQHDPGTLVPVGARSYEPPSLSGLESVGAVRVLMKVERPPPEVIDAVEAAVRWFEASRLAARDGGAPRWARFYDLATQAPIYPDRDGTVHASLDALSAERRNGYRYTTDAPDLLLTRDYPAWRRRVGRPR